MKLTQEQVIDMIAKPNDPVTEIQGQDLLRQYAEVLASMSGSITDVDLAELLVIGVGFYQLQFNGWEHGIDQPDLFAALQRRWGKEGR